MMRRRAFTALVGSLILWSCTGSDERSGSEAPRSEQPSPPGSAGFLARTVTVLGSPHRYQVYVPPEWSAASRWPVILYLHGARERGDDGALQLSEALGPAIRRNPERFPCIVVFPQCPRDHSWVEPDMQALALAALEAAVGEWHGDSGRISLTGKSMGGAGVWKLASEHPGMFCSLAPVSGFVEPHEGSGAADGYSATARLIGRTPVWIFHGSDDPVVPVAEARGMEKALQAAGGVVRYTEYPGGQHEIWDRAYGEPDLAAWLLSKSPGPDRK